MSSCSYCHSLSLAWTSLRSITSSFRHCLGHQSQRLCFPSQPRVDRHCLYHPLEIMYLVNSSVQLCWMYQRSLTFEKNRRAMFYIPLGYQTNLGKQFVSFYFIHLVAPLFSFVDHAHDPIAPTSCLGRQLDSTAYNIHFAGRQLDAVVLNNVTMHDRLN